MNNNTQISTQVYYGLMNALFIVFFVLKLTDTIDWSWWYVTLPLWFGIVIDIISIVFSLLLSILIVNSILLYRYIRRLLTK